MMQVIVGGDRQRVGQLQGWLAGWGLQCADLPADGRPDAVPAGRAAAVIWIHGPQAPEVPAADARSSLDPAAAPMLLLGADAPAHLVAGAWAALDDAGPDGADLAAVLRPCLERSGQADADFHDFLNHELRTPLTAAGTALQMLALHMERAGGQSLELVDIALRNVRRLEQTIDWACDHFAGGGDPLDEPAEEAELLDLLEDLDGVDAPVDLEWRTGAGDWSTRVMVGRQQWRRLLRQVLRAVSFHTPGERVGLEVSTVTGEQDTGLLLVFHLPYAARDTVRVAGEGDGPAQLRRLLDFTVNPEVAEQMRLRMDVVRLSEHLRLRLLLPLTVAAPELQPA
jgi:hypothetical protein